MNDNQSPFKKWWIVEILWIVGGFNIFFAITNNIWLAAMGGVGLAFLWWKFGRAYL